MDAQHKDEANYINRSVVEPLPPPYTKLPIENTDIELDFTEPVKKFCNSCQQEVNQMHFITQNFIQGF